MLLDFERISNSEDPQAQKKLKGKVTGCIHLTTQYNKLEVRVRDTKCQWHIRKGLEGRSVITGKPA